MPTPTVTKLLPAGIPVGAALKLYVEGVNFDASSVVYFGTESLATEYLAYPEYGVLPFLRAVLPSDLLTGAGSISVTVQNASDGSVSGSVPFAVYAGLPESPHPALDDYFSIRYTEPGTPARIWLTFDPQTYVYNGDGVDYDGSITVEDQLGATQVYRSSELAGRTIDLAGDTAIITMTRGGDRFGFRVSDIRTSAPAANGYLLGNRHGEDQGRFNILESYFDGPLGATHVVGTPQILPECLVDTEYSYQFTFPNAAGPVTWSIVSGTAPNLTLNAATGVLSGTTPAFSTSATFIVEAVDNDGKSARGSFLLRVFAPPAKIDQFAAGPTTVFALAGKLYAVFATAQNSPVYRYAPVVKRSSDEGVTWEKLNVGETNGGEQIDIFWNGTSLYFSFWSEENVPAVKSYNLATNQYAAMYQGHSFWFRSDSNSRLFVKPDGSVVQFLTGIGPGQTGSTHNVQVFMVTANGTIDTAISTNVPTLNGGMGTPLVSASLATVLMDGSGAFHIFWSVLTFPDRTVPNISFERFYYRRVGLDGALGSIVELDHPLLRPTEQCAFGNGFVRSEGDEIVLPVKVSSQSQYFYYGRLAVLRGAPLLAPVFTVELVDAPANRDSSNEYFAPQGTSNNSGSFHDGMSAVEDANGDDVVFFCSGDQVLSDLRAGAIWMVRNRRDGNGWTYRDRFYDCTSMPMVPKIGSFDSLGIPVAIPDVNAANGLRLFFTWFASGGSGSGGVYDAGQLMALHYPTPVKAITCGNPPGAFAGAAYTHALPHTGSPPFTFAVTGGALPPGLSLDPTTGVISGTPTGALICRGILHLDKTTQNDQGQAIECLWESGQVRGASEHASRMIRVGNLDLWIRGEGDLATTIFGPDKRVSVQPKLLTTGGVESELSPEPGTMYQEKFDLSKIENYTVAVKTNEVDAWFELSGFTGYTKQDLFNK